MTLDANDIAREHGVAALREAWDRAAYRPSVRDARAARGNGRDDAGHGDADVLARLAALAPLEYDRVREAEAKRLGVRTSTLDAEMRRRRGETGTAEGCLAGGLDDPEPWPHPVSGGEVLDGLAAAARRHLVLPAGAADAIALWVVHAHAHEAAAISPILAVTSPTPECGKTTLLTLLGGLVPRALAASNITAAATFRAVELWRPTLLIDEADTFLRESDELRGVLNSGHNRAQAFVVRTVGDAHEPRRFATWAPKAIALIGRLPATLESRAVHIELQRLGDGEHVEPLRGDRLAHLEPLRRKGWRWASDNAARLSTTDPAMPPTLRGRPADNWRALIAIADVAGGDWPMKARRAAELLSAGRSERTAGVMLLEDIRRIFAERETDRLTSGEIVAALAEMDASRGPNGRGESRSPRAALPSSSIRSRSGRRPSDCRAAQHPKATRARASPTPSDAISPTYPPHRNK